MVEEIYKMKNDILKQIEKEIGERGIERIDVNRIGEMVDMVKDLAEAEKSCWEASYYRQVSEAMEGSSGYSSMGGGRSGYGSQQSSMRQGYGSTGSMGHGDLIDKLGEEFRNMDPSERMSMKNKVLTVLGSM